MLNAAARLVFSTRKHEAVSSLLRDLHWLRVPQWIEFKLAVLTYHCLHSTVWVEVSVNVDARRTVDVTSHHWRPCISGRGFARMEQPAVQRHLVNITDSFLPSLSAWSWDCWVGKVQIKQLGRRRPLWLTRNWSSCCNVICVCWRRCAGQKPKPTYWNCDCLAVTIHVYHTTLNGTNPVMVVYRPNDCMGWYNKTNPNVHSNSVLTTKVWILGKTNLKTKLDYKTSKAYSVLSIRDSLCIGAADVNSASWQPIGHQNRRSEAADDAGIARKWR